MLTVGLFSIIQDCISDFNSVSSNLNIVSNSAPILWFGDIEAYRKSSKRVLTVALNPSLKEFRIKPNNAFSVSARFPHLQYPGCSVCQYYDAMNEYFMQKPLWSWFCHPELLLNQLCGGTSYKSGCVNTAVHLDFYTPAATCPTWGKLPCSDKILLCKKFGQYFDRMLQELAPNVIVASFDNNIIAQVFQDNSGRPCSPGNAINPWICRKGNRNYYLRAYQLPNNRVLLSALNLRGQACGGLSDTDFNNAVQYLKSSNPWLSGMI